MSDVTPEIPTATDADVFLTRAFAAPRELVWRFFTEPELLASWFGPSSVHVDPSTVVVELEAGGRWELDMVDDETGEHYPIRFRVTSLVPGEYLEADEPSGDFGPGDLIRLRIWLHDHGDRTRLTLHQGPFTAEARDMTAEGWESSFQKIDARLAEKAGA